MTLKLSEHAEKFKEWVSTAVPNSKFVYHIGGGLYDTMVAAQVKKIAWESASTGDIYLVQRKVTTNIFEYIAIKANNPPNPKLVPLIDPLPRGTHDGNSHYTPRKVRLLERVYG